MFWLSISNDLPSMVPQEYCAERGDDEKARRDRFAAGHVAEHGQFYLARKRESGAAQSNFDGWR